MAFTLALAAPLLVLLSQEPAKAPPPEVLTGESLASARLTLSATAIATKGVAFIEAEFVQFQHSALLVEPLESKGSLQIRTSPSCLVLRFSEPRQVLVRSDSSSHLLYDPVRKTAEKFIFTRNELATSIASLFTPDIEHMEKHFYLTRFAATELHETVGMTPRSETVRKFLPELTVRISRESGLPDQISYRNADGEETVLNLSGLVKHESAESLKLPFGFKIPDEVTVMVHEVEEAKRPDEGEADDGHSADL